MLQETILYLLIIGLFSLIKTREKYDGILSCIVTAFTLLVFFCFLSDYKLGYEGIQTYVLDQEQRGNIKLEIISSLQNYILIFPFFISTILALINNVIFRYEPQKKVVAGLFVLNLISFMMLISGNNFLQIITFVFIIDILSQLLVRDTNAGKRYSLYNFAADMGLFLVLAMLQGKLTNLDIGNISHYYETGRHRDFIMFVIMASLSVKFGFFLFQGYWLDLRSAKFHNLYFLPYLSTPMAALILFIKFYPLLIVSPSFLPLLNIITILTMIWGVLGAILSPQIKEKFVYCNMVNIAFLVQVVEKMNFLWNVHLSNILILLFSFNLCLYYLHYEVDRNHAKNKLSLYFILAAFVADISGLSVQISEISTSETLKLVVAYGFLSICIMAYIFYQIGLKLKGEFSFKQIDYRTMFTMLLIIAVCYIFSKTELLRCWPICFVWAAFILLCRIHPFSFLRPRETIYAKIQNIDILEWTYNKIIIDPIKRAGLLFNILTDFIFLERTISPCLAKTNIALIRAYRHISRLGLIYYLLCTILGVVFAIWLFY